MKSTLFLLLLLVAAPGASAQGVPVSLDQAKPVTVQLVDAGIEEAIATVGELAGIAIQWDANVSEQVRSQPAAVRISLVNARAGEALAFLTKQAGLRYEVVDSKTVRITPAAQ